MQTSLKFVILRNSIGEFAQPHASCTFFRNSLEGIPCAPRTQRTLNSQATSQCSNAPATSQHSNAPLSNNTRFTQRADMPTVNADETGWIVKIIELEILAYYGWTEALNYAQTTVLSATSANT